MPPIVPDLDDAALAENHEVNERLRSLLGGGHRLPERHELPELRRRRRDGAPPFPPPWRLPGAVDAIVEGPAGGVPVRLLAPPVVRGVHVHVAGGGWCTNAPDITDGPLWALARAAEVLVVCVGHRSAPEDPFPAGVDDVVAVLRWVLSRRVRVPGPRTFGGDSTGAHVALLATLRERAVRPPLDGLVLLVGIYDLTDAAAWRTASSGTDPLLSPLLLARYVDWFVPVPDERPAASPLRLPLDALPATVVVGAELDPLAGDSRRLAEDAVGAGVDVTYIEYPDASHGFFTFGTAMAGDAIMRQADFLRRLRRDAVGTGWRR